MKTKRWVAGALALLLLLGLLVWQLWLREDEPSLADPAGHIPFIKLPLDGNLYWDAETHERKFETQLEYKLQGGYYPRDATPEERAAWERWCGEYTLDLLRRVAEGKPAVLRYLSEGEGNWEGKGGGGMINEIRYDPETQQFRYITDMRRCND